jgi:hypothetical protein
MQQITLRILLSIGFVALLGSRMTSIGTQVIPPYRLLWSGEPNPGGIPLRLDYFVSVPNFIDRSAVEGVVCKVIKEEKPKQGAEVGIMIFQGLKELSPLSLMFDREPYEHDIAIYAWNSGGGLLTVMRDLQGSRIKPLMTTEFDHSKACSNR